MTRTLFDDRRTLRFGAVTAADIAALDAAALDLGVDILQLMEAAGMQVARAAWRMLGRTPRHLHVLAGRGHNGGDGLVAARHLSSWGCEVTATVLSRADRLDALMTLQCRAARGAGVAVHIGESGGGRGDPALTIDALLGTGLHGLPRGPTAEAIAALTGPVLSVDIPSGMDAGDGIAPGIAVSATATVTMVACKRGFWTRGSRAFTGELLLADIGMPRTAWRRCGLHQPSAVAGGAMTRVPPPR